MEDQIRLISSLDEMIESIKETLSQYEKILIKEKERLLQYCSKHEFLATSNGDYHKPGYFFTCKHCQYWTNIKPKDYPIIYTNDNNF